MFKNLANFAYTRDIKGAIGFYVAYLIFTIILGTLIATVLGLLINQSSFGFGLRIGTFTAIVMSAGLSFLIVKNKNLSSNFLFILIALLSGLLALLGGGILGLIPTAYLSTRSPVK